jgi:hypothetical protein
VVLIMVGNGEVALHSLTVEQRWAVWDALPLAKARVFNCDAGDVERLVSAVESGSLFQAKMSVPTYGRCQYPTPGFLPVAGCREGIFVPPWSASAVRP